MAMQWTEGDYEDLGSEAWLSSEDTQDEHSEIPSDRPRKTGRNRSQGSISRNITGYSKSKADPK